MIAKKQILSGKDYQLSWISLKKYPWAAVVGELNCDRLKKSVQKMSKHRK